mgnify:CR=1 FL=1
MDKAADIANQAQASLREGVRRPGTRTTGTIDMATRAHRLKFIDRLFVMLHVTYGHLFSSQFPSDDLLRTAKAQWALQLHPWSEANIERALYRAKRVYRERPPTLPQFVDLLRTDRAHEEYQALPRPPCDKDKARAQIDAMRGILKRSA